MNISSNLACDSNDGKYFTDRLFSKFRKAFANNSSTNVKLSQTQLHKRRQSGGFLDRILGLLLKTGCL